MKGTISKIPIQAANRCNILPRAADSTDWLWRNWKEILSQYAQMSYNRC